MVSLLRQCPGKSGKVCVHFLPPRTVTPIAFVLLVELRFVTLKIGTKIAMIGLMRNGGVWVSIWLNFLFRMKRSRGKLNPLPLFLFLGFPPSPHAIAPVSYNIPF